ncbi:dihydrodipicolinate synthase family protein [Rhodothermus marinus]|uniref:Dihydrodipicolinate synthetase n=1 Tax=Rhodothermus marinus (strain ATCC 43812 / DSM 4252 / R-10) TaxID=518766 RepID=D0MEU6_RHOM4|nr:dihydrodipicolinate synthase family protein [Rhodothermus marinus]ACY47396.1 dihydrodipicolinate synthetase [Rhodothermus marinus DSM 4252]
METPGSNWQGVFPAVTTPFTEEDRVDVPGLHRLVDFLIEGGVDGLIMLGTLGEGSVLSPEEKELVLREALAAADGRVPVLAGVAETTTRAACRFAERAAALGVQGFMALPALLYNALPHETLAHFQALARATDLPLMLYNNPVLYGVDVTPEMLAELADESRIVAVKESSEDVRRITDIRVHTGDRYRLFVGVDDLVLEGVAAGADGWVAGLTNAFPRESVALFRLARAGRLDEARRLYHWFMPLLHLDASPQLVQHIKLAQALVGVGSEHVRPPRRPLQGERRRAVEALIRKALDTHAEIEDLL